MSADNKLNCTQAKEIDMVDYLSSLGYEPQKIRNNDYWYISPLRDEKSPSFKVNRKLNAWFDFGEGKGGNIIDFGILFHHCTVSEFLEQLSNGNFSFDRHVAVNKPKEEDITSKIKILRERPLLSYALCKYLHERKISL